MSLSSFSDGEFNGAYSNFYVSAQLTKKGLANYKEVISVIYKQAKLLAESTPVEFIFEEAYRIG
jgi:secreted Zn-dependent insulinase-like peptidase